MAAEALDLRWEQLSRYRLIEIIALWEGRLTTKHLCQAFGIGRQQASKDINTYLSEIAPENLTYDKTLKGYRPASYFKPQLTSGTADEYLHFLDRNQELAQTFEGMELPNANTELLPLPTRHIKPNLLRPLVLAARHKRRVKINYVSLSNPTPSNRTIAPHTLVCTGNRWHVRAYCERNQEFRDFVLSRFKKVSDVLDRSEHTVEEDTAWNARVKIRVKPDPRLNPAQQKIVANDYGMKRGSLILNTRGSLVHYVLNSLHIDPTEKKRKAIAQQIVVDNLDELDGWLW